MAGRPPAFGQAGADAVPGSDPAVFHQRFSNGGVHGTEQRAAGISEQAGPSDLSRPLGRDFGHGGAGRPHRPPRRGRTAFPGDLDGRSGAGPGLYPGFSAGFRHRKHERDAVDHHGGNAALPAAGSVLEADRPDERGGLGLPSGPGPGCQPGLRMGGAGRQDSGGSPLPALQDVSPLCGLVRGGAVSVPVPGNGAARPGEGLGPASGPVRAV